MEPVRHVIFDLDGTLVDSLPGIAWSVEAALSCCGLPRPSTDLKPLIGPPIRSILSAVSGVREPVRLNELEQAFRCSYDSLGWRRTRCYDGVADLLRQLLAGGIGRWMVTNKPCRVTHDILRELQISDFFQEVACRDSRIPLFPSKAEVLGDLLRRRALRRSSCLMVGDTLEDSDAAIAAGIGCAIVPHGYGTGLGMALPTGCQRVNGWEEIAELCDVPLSATERC